DIVLPIDECPAADAPLTGQGADEAWRAGAALGGRRGRSEGSRRMHARASGRGALAGGGGARRGAVCERRVEAEHTATGAGAASALGRVARKKRLQELIPHETAAGLRVKMHTRREAAGHEHQVAGLPLRGERLPLSVELCEA